MPVRPGLTQLGTAVSRHGKLEEGALELHLLGIGRGPVDQTAA